jgi:AcrR family transcriptional regulator
MTERRPQGRPARGANEVGRDKIVQNLRAMMREPAFKDYSRKTLAEYSGVTPALITYYFPNWKVIVEETTEPVVSGYFHELRAIVTSDEHPTERLRKVIRLLIKCHSRDGNILKAYINLVRLDDSRETPDYVDLMSKELAGFIDTLIGGDPSRPSDSEVLQCAIWGMCEFVTRGNLEAMRATGATWDEAASEVDVSLRLFDLITHGLSYWIPPTNLEVHEPAEPTKMA